MKILSLKNSSPRNSSLGRILSTRDKCYPIFWVSLTIIKYFKFHRIGHIINNRIVQFCPIAWIFVWLVALLTKLACQCFDKKYIAFCSLVFTVLTESKPVRRTGSEIRTTAKQLKTWNHEVIDTLIRNSKKHHFT